MTSERVQRLVGDSGQHTSQLPRPGPPPKRAFAFPRDHSALEPAPPPKSEPHLQACSLGSHLHSLVSSG